jgi:DNA replication protein DnaC
MHPIQDIIPAPSLIERGILSQDAASLTWQCPTCGTVAPGRWGNSGWFVRRQCACQLQAEVERRRQADRHEQQQALLAYQRAMVFGWLGQSWPQRGLNTMTFETFEQSLQREAYNQARAFANEAHDTLLLYGSYGLGKTHLLAAIANQRGSKPGGATLFASAVTLFDAIQDRIWQKEDYHDLLKRAIATPLLVLDDVDKPKPSDFRQEVLYQIIDGRTREHKPLAVSCNCSPADLDRFVGGAARSRLMQGVILLKMVGQDYRLGASA